MASKEAEDPSNNTAGTDEETIALRQKRLRRVSFADREITSVHIFNRDEDYETPPNSSASKPQNDEQAGAVGSENKLIRLFGELADSDDSRELPCSSPEDEEEADAEDEVVNGKQFLRPKGSPSSGGSTIGSATSNDEDNFFGPVSSHFIRPGRFSDSAVSEENHDFTMDSTAFSMHFRSLGVSDPGDFKTPTTTRGHITLEEKTPTQVISRLDTGDAMVLTEARKLSPKSPHRVSGGRDSNDMSLVDDNSQKYDYARLSPTLEALLAAVRERESIKNVSLSAEITFDCRKEKQGVSTPSKIVPFPANGSNVKIQSSIGHRNHRQHDQGSKPISNCGTEGGNSIDKCAGGDSMKVIPRKLDSLHVESGLLLSEASNLNGSAQLKRKHSPLNAIQDTAKHISVSHSPLKTRTPLKSQFGSPVKDLRVPARVIENISGTPASPCVDRGRYEPSVVKLNEGTSYGKATNSPSSFKRLTRSQSKKELNNAKRKENLQLAGENFSSLKASLKGGDNVHSQESVGLSRISEQDAENDARLKRKTDDIEHQVGSGRARRRPKVQKRTHFLESVSDDISENNDANKVIGIRDKIENWTDIPRKVSAETYQLFEPLTQKLNSRLTGKLEDILTCLKKAHLCEMLCFQIQTQKVYDTPSGAKSKRHAESRLLLCRIAYAKAKLQLLHLKQERLLKKIQAVSSGFQTFRTLRLNYAKLMHRHGERDGQDKSSCCSTVLVNPDQVHEVTTDKGSELTHELRVLDSKIENLIKSIRTRYKMKGDPTYVDTSSILKDHLKWKMQCRLIRQDMQLWKVDGLNKNDIRSVVLNYGGFINQRLTLKPEAVSSVLVSNKLNDTVMKNYFPGMDASNAFAFLFSTEYTIKYVASKTLVEETQKTGLVLSSLLDVADELQLARMELQNLVQATFIFPSEQLHLQIGFINRRSCRKVTVVLDIICLTCGIYPADIIPCKLLQTNATGGEGSLPELLQTEIKSAINDLRVGYPRILRLCQCVSRVLQS